MRVARLSCSQSASGWMTGQTGRKRSHGDSIQLRDKWGARSDNVDYVTGQVTMPDCVTKGRLRCGAWVVGVA